MRRRPIRLSLRKLIILVAIVGLLLAFARMLAIIRRDVAEKSAEFRWSDVPDSAY